MIGKSGKKTPKEDSVNLAADTSTRLAMERNYMASDRTLMAWVRTSLSMISFGFTLGKLGQVLQDVSIKRLVGGTRTVSIEQLAYFLVIIGTVALLGATIQHWNRMRELHAMGLRHRYSITLLVSLVLVAVGAFAFTALVLAL
jgi:putative membrane protein